MISSSPVILFLSLLLHPDLTQSSSCPSQSISKCFNKFFAAYRFMQWPTCQTFDYMEKCFQLGHQCDRMELAHLCAVEYRKIHNAYMPKEAIVAVHENLRRRCADDRGNGGGEQHCHRNSEFECSSKLIRHSEFAKDRDQALLMEIKALKRQLDLNMSPPSLACPQIASALKRLHSNRRQICTENSVYCYCKRLFDDENLLQTCQNLRCDAYRNRKNRTAAIKLVTSNLNLSLVCLSLWIIYVYRFN